MRYLDVSREIAAGMKKYPSDPMVEISAFKSIDKGDSCNLNKLVMGSHTGTHVDAPCHIFKNGYGVDSIKLHNLICDAFVIDIGRCLEKAFLKKITSKGVRGMLFKNAKKGLTIAEAKELIRSGVKIIGTDQMSIENSHDRSHPVHRLLLGKGITVVENLDLTKAKAGQCKLLCLPLKVKNGDGAPARAILAYD